MINVELRAEYDAIMKELMKPIDFDQLIADGVLEKWGDGYHLLDHKRLPHHASMKIESFAFVHPFGPTTVRFETFPER